MTDQEHKHLAEVLHSIQGKVAISGYQCSLMDRLYGDFYRFEAETQKCHSTKDDRQEILWANYKLPISEG
jgi:DNA adenine methylase